MYTLGFPFRPWTGEKAIADGADIRTYVEETAREYGLDGEYPVRLQGGARRLVVGRCALDGRGRRRRDLHLQLPVPVRRLLRLRKWLPARLGRRGRLSRPHRPSPILAGRSRSCRQEDRRDRQRRDRGHPGPGSGRDRGAGHDGAALALLHRLSAVARRPRPQAPARAPALARRQGDALEECAARHVLLLARPRAAGQGPRQDPRAHRQGPARPRSVARLFAQLQSVGSARSA